VAELAPKPAKELFLKHYNSLTFGNELKPESVLDYDATIAYMEANGGDQVNPQITLRAARPLLEFAKEHNIPVRGHTLVWHSQTPDWFSEKITLRTKMLLGIDFTISYCNILQEFFNFCPDIFHIGSGLKTGSNVSVSVNYELGKIPLDIALFL